MSFFKGIDKKQAISWAFFDFANSAYTLIVGSFVFPIFFKEVIAKGTAGDFWWGLAVSISIMIGGLLTPIIGAIADHDKRRKRKFVMLSIVGIIGCASLYFTGPGMLLFGSLLFIITNIAVELVLSLYDSFLVNVSTKKTAGRISGLGWGLGYIGGILAMLLFKPLYSLNYATNTVLYKITFPLTALFFLIFSLPSFIILKEKKANPKKEPLINLIKIGFNKIWRTFKSIKKHRQVAWFLLAFYIMNDALVTIFNFIPIFARTTLSLSISEIAVIFLIIQLIGFPSAIFFGWLSDNKGSKKILLFTIFIWILIILGISFLKSRIFFYIIAALTGLVIGTNQAIARAWFSKLIPHEKRCEFFGFNGFASKIAATTGPVLFGIISTLTGSQRIAMLSLLPYFIISFIIFSKIPESK
jgi:UMF1 family MFS transporter